MAQRRPTNWSDLASTLAELFSFKDQYTAQSLDFHGRRIKNASPSVDELDYVVRKELHDLVGGGLSQPPLGSKGTAKTYDKITFGIGVGASVVIGNDLTPPYIWSNSASGKPAIILVAANTPPAGDDLDFDVKKNGTSIFSAGKFTIPGGTGPKSVISSTTVFQSGINFSRPNVMSIDVTKIGTTTPGRQVTVTIFCTLL